MLIGALAAVWTLLPVIASLSRAFIAGLLTIAQRHVCTFEALGARPVRRRISRTSSSGRLSGTNERMLRRLSLIERITSRLTTSLSKTETDMQLPFLTSGELSSGAAETA